MARALRWITLLRWVSAAVSGIVAVPVVALVSHDEIREVAEQVQCEVKVMEFCRFCFDLEELSSARRRHISRQQMRSRGGRQ